ncbi:MAG: hypothetical protein DMG53_00990 [Acidobacteria bacterium]|nr:MAG: hypothetical protein DMG53_00990 [Acidobacteriota bacterium]
MPPKEAQRAARIELGGIEQVKEQVRQKRTGNWLPSVISDCRYGLRQLRKNPGFTAVAVLTLALGIGANTAIFSVVDAVLLRPLPFEAPSRLIAIHEGIPKMGYPKMGFSPPDLAIFAREQKSFSAIGTFRNKPVNISGRDEPERVMAARVSSSLFPMLGVEPMLGRTFASDEDTPGHNVVLLSYGLWQRRYGGVSSILGQTIDIDRQPYTVVGVMPQKFEFPLPGPDDNGSPADLWVPMAFLPAELQGWGGSYLTSVVGRLRPGITLEQVRGSTEPLAQEVLASYPAALTKTFRAAELSISPFPFQDDVVGSVRTLLLVRRTRIPSSLLGPEFYSRPGSFEHPSAASPIAPCRCVRFRGRHVYLGRRSLWARSGFPTVVDLDRRSFTGKRTERDTFPLAPPSPGIFCHRGICAGVRAADWSRTLDSQLRQAARNESGFSSRQRAYLEYSSASRSLSPRSADQEFLPPIARPRFDFAGRAECRTIKRSASQCP